VCTRLAETVKFFAKTIINASALEVFRVVSDAALYPQFDPNCLKVYGRIEEGQSLIIHSRNGQKIYKPDVVSVVKDQKIILKTSLPFALFQNKWTFTIIPKDDFTTEFRREDEGQGPLLYFLKKEIPDQTSIREFCLGLKRFIESRP